MANPEGYWARRAKEREERWNEKCREELEREMARQYAAALRAIERDILALYGTFVADNGLSMQAARKLLHGQEFREWRMGMGEYIDEIHRLEQAGHYAKSEGLMRELNTLAMRSRISRLDKLRSETLRELDSLGRKRETAMGKFLADAYRDNYYRSAFDLAKAGEFRGSFAKVDPRQVESILREPWSGRNYSQRIWKDMRKLETAIQDAVVQGIHRGVSSSKMTKMVMERMGVSRSNAERLVRTELCYVQNQSSLESIKDSGMGFYRVSAAFDKRTCSTCAAKDGKEVPVEDASPGDTLPPFHARCRCTIAASFGDGARSKGKRIARDRDGKSIRIPADMKYSEWKAIHVDGTKTLAEWKREQPVHKNALQAAGEGAKISMKGGGGLEQAKKRDHKIMITDVAISKVPCVEVPGLSKETCKAIQEEHKAILRMAQKENGSNEVLSVWDFAKARRFRVLGTENYVNPALSPEAYGICSAAEPSGVAYLHNHPSTRKFSLADIDTFVGERYIGLISVVTNQGEVYILHKGAKYSYRVVRELMLQIYDECKGDTDMMVELFLHRCGKAGISYGKSK